MAAMLALGMAAGLLLGSARGPRGTEIGAELIGKQEREQTARGSAAEGAEESRLWLVPDGAAEAREDDGEERIKLPSSRLTVSLGGEPREMELEEYLVGVVAGEMSASSEPEALKAQAVAARTFTALHMAGRARCKSGCTVCTDPSCCQAYLGEDELKAAWGGKYDENIAKIRAAVEGTRGTVVVYEGELISALYHASSGSATESSEAVFAMALPYLVSVTSPEDDSETVSVQRFGAEELAQKLNEAFPEAMLSAPLTVDAISVLERSESGRVQRVKIGNTEVSGCMLRAALGLRSTAFTLVQDGDGAAFTCTGYGHGVGMSQLGANEMAREGADYEQILEHYYTGTRLARAEYEN